MTYQPPISLSRAAVSHWSTASYGRGPTGHISARAQLDGRGLVEVPGGGPYVYLGLDTPGGKAPEGIHGGARRIDVGLTVEQARILADLLNAAAALADLERKGL